MTGNIESSRVTFRALKRQPTYCLPLIVEAGEHLRSVHSELHHFQSHAPADGLELFGQIDGAHATFAQELDDPIAAEVRIPRHGCGGTNRLSPELVATGTPKCDLDQTLRARATELTFDAGSAFAALGVIALAAILVSVMPVLVGRRFARSGRLLAARGASNRAVDLALQEGGREAAASYLAARAVWEAVCGNAAEGKRTSMAALELSKGRDVQYAAGLALAVSGESTRSEALAVDLERRFPEDTFVKFTYLPVLHALAELGRRKPADSVERLQIALRYELAANALNFEHFYLGGLHSAYVRGEALTAAHRYSEAAAEFQKILAHRGLVGMDPIGALAHLQLGRAYASSGDRSKAKAAYEAFLAIWKDADHDIPILKSAKAEYARL